MVNVTLDMRIMMVINATDVTQMSARADGLKNQVHFNGLIL